MRLRCWFVVGLVLMAITVFDTPLAYGATGSAEVSHTGSYEKVLGGPDEFTVTDSKNRQLEAKQSMCGAAPDNAQLLGLIACSAAAGNHATFGGRPATEGCFFTVGGVFVGGGPGVGGRGSVAAWDAYFDDATTPKIVMRMNGEGTIDDNIAVGKTGTLFIALLNAPAGTSYEVTLAQTGDGIVSPSPTKVSVGGTSSAKSVELRGTKEGSVQISGRITGCCLTGGAPRNPPLSGTVTTVVGIAKVVLDGSSPDNAGPLCVPVGTKVALRAKPNPAVPDWPSGFPVWSLGDHPTGTSSDVISFTPDAAGTYVLAASCGTSSKSITVTAVTATISPLTRVPMFNAQTPNDASVSVTLTPSPLPAGTSVTVELSTTAGAGSATFDDGLKTKTITETTIVKVRGAANSDENKNIKLGARVGDKALGSMLFTVSTWPINMHCVSNLKTTDALFTLPVNLVWDSESGKTDDLANVLLREYVTADAAPNPPFMRQAPSLTIGPKNPKGGSGWVATDTNAPDPHHYWKEWVNFDKRDTGTMTTLQLYQFQDTVMETEWAELARYTISRVVAVDPNGTYTFTMSKVGTGNFNLTRTQKP